MMKSPEIEDIFEGFYKEKAIHEETDLRGWHFVELCCVLSEETEKTVIDWLATLKPGSCKYVWPDRVWFSNVEDAILYKIMWCDDKS